ncbi:MAG TPA: hydroxyproline-2-epimerase, partial [Planctomycetes bacterium]|nr:hydroxyproline-2-epimerase [Planctomycetota bacterium]
LAADNKLHPGDVWIQESIIGSRFTATFRIDDSGRIIPCLNGRAFICSEASFVMQPDDPYINGIT